MAHTFSASVVDSMQQISSGGVLVGADIDLTSALAGGLTIHMGPDSTTAVTAAGYAIVQVSAQASGDDDWADWETLTMGTTTAESEAVTGTEAAGSTVIEVASTTNLTVGDNILFKNGTAGNSEFAKIISVSTNTSVTVADGIKNAQTSSTIYDQAYRWPVRLPWGDFQRARVLYFGATGPTTMIQTFLNVMTAL